MIVFRLERHNGLSEDMTDQKFSKAKIWQQRINKGINKLIDIGLQVQQIIDEGSGRRRSVIIQVGSENEVIDRLMRVGAEVHRRRNMCSSARDLLPVRQEKMEKLRALAGKRLNRNHMPFSAEASLSAQVGSAIYSFDRKVVQAARSASMDMLLTNELVLKALSDVSTLRQRNALDSKKALDTRNASDEGQAPARFWSSQSVVLSINKDDLYKLSQLSSTEPSHIRGIYPNRPLRTPRLIEAKNLPQAITEERASSWGVNRIGALSAWGAYKARGKGIKIALLDTGVDATHPDLAGKLTQWSEFNSNGGEVFGSAPHDTDQHGTHCAGTIVGGNSSGAWIGVAPEADLLAALVLNGDKGGTPAQVLAGMQWAIDNEVDVISMSLGNLTLELEAPGPYTEALLTALLLGIPVVTAIGNDGSQTTGSPGNDYFAFSVGATDFRDRPAGFSGGRTHMLRQSDFLDPLDLPFAYSKPELSAPGVAIRSSVPKGKWASLNGTSMAAPHVAGAIAVLLSATNIKEKVPPEERAFLLQDLLTGSVEELGESGQDHRYGFGRIDVLKAIGFAKELGY